MAATIRGAYAALVLRGNSGSGWRGRSRLRVTICSSISDTGVVFNLTSKISKSGEQFLH